MPDLDYVKVIGRFGIVVGDGSDPDEYPDTIWCDQGTVQITPLIPVTRVPDGDPVPWTGGQHTISAGVDDDGHLTWLERDYLWVVDLTSEKVFPRVPADAATHRLDFKTMKANNITVEFPTVFVRLAADVVDPETGAIDLTDAMPIATSTTPVGVFRGPTGVGIEDVTVVGDNLEVELDNGETKSTPLPVTMLDNAEFMGEQIDADGTPANLAVIAQTLLAVEATALTRDSNLADLPSAPAARSSLGLGTAATQPATAFDAAGSAAAVQAQVNALTPSGAFRGTYSNATSYVQGDQVTYNGVVYAAPAAIASGGTAPGAGGSVWVALPSGTDLKARGDIGLINSVIQFVASVPLDNRVDIATITSSAPSDRRFICQKALPQGKIESVALHARFAVNPFSVELWESDGTTLTRKAVVTQALAVGINVVPLSWYINDPSKTYFIGVQSGGAANISLNPAGSPTNPWWTNTDETSTSLTIAGMTANTSLSMYIKIDALVARPATTTRPPTIVVAPSGGDFTTIQAALDAAPDTATNQVRIEIYPKPNGGTYERFSHVGFPFQTGSSALTRTRYVDMIGMGKVVIKDDTGDYRTPPAEIRTVGTIRNIDFIATHDTPFSDPTEAALARRSYAVHMDFGGYQNVLFEDCGFYSKHGPALGIGLHQDERIVMRRCIVETIADPAFGGLANYGAFFAHSSSQNGITNQGIVLDDVWIYAPVGVPTDAGHGGPNGGCGLWVSVAGSFVDSSMFIRANRVSVKGPAGGADVIRDSRIALDSGSWRNDPSDLDAP